MVSAKDIKEIIDEEITKASEDRRVKVALRRVAKRVEDLENTDINILIQKMHDQDEADRQERMRRADEIFKQQLQRIGQ